MDVDPASNLVVVADGSSGLQAIDITNAATPQIIGTVNTNGDARDVVLLGSIAFVADYTGGLKAVNIINPAIPVIEKSVGDNFLFDIAVNGLGDFAFGADVFRVNASPI